LKIIEELVKSFKSDSLVSGEDNANNQNGEESDEE